MEFNWNRWKETRINKKYTQYQNKSLALHSIEPINLYDLNLMLDTFTKPVLTKDLPYNKKKEMKWTHKIFPDRILLYMIPCLLVKLIFFSYTIYCYNQGLSIKQDTIFTRFTIQWWHFELLNDYNNDYLLWRELYLSGEFLYSDVFKGRYKYPPVFFIIINLLSPWTKYSAPIIILCCNMLTGYFLYRLLRNLSINVRNARISLVLCLLSPINLIYSDFIWQNAVVVISFLTITMFQITEHKYTSGMLWLGFAMCIKQIAFFCYPVCILAVSYSPATYFHNTHLYNFNDKNRDSKPKIRKIQSAFINFPYRKILYYGIIPIILFFFVSIPFLIIDAEGYINQLFGLYKVTNFDYFTAYYDKIVPVKYQGNIIGYLPDLTIKPGKKSYQYNYRGSLALAFAWIGYFLQIPTKYTIFFAIWFVKHYFLFFFFFIIIIFYWWQLNLKKIRTLNQYYWNLWKFMGLSILCALIFSRVGIYKYYFVSLIPFFASYGFFAKFNTSPMSSWLSHHDLSIFNSYRAGGILFLIFEQVSIQIIFIFINKWLLALIFGFPLFIFQLVISFKNIGI